jgi:hypothetical protein
VRERHRHGQGAQHDHHTDTNAAGALFLFLKPGNTESCIFAHGSPFMRYELTNHNMELGKPATRMDFL